MPSFRVSLGIFDALPGVRPEAVLEQARDAVAQARQVEDAHIDVTPVTRGDGVPRVVVRFFEPATNEAAEDASAWQVAALLATAVRRVAVTSALRVHRRRGGRWLIRPAPDEATW